ncbi:hypothetical protein HHI36_024093 [Cryptolaemus montrouzieri]|uniref:Ionotropic glutamate receptor C-terminal domain-containing protein n=1 Tax=Cryptolaemus montrouzieri TaxID=559131 RepID=A0ABD2N0U0_9CUCU
MVEVLEEQKLNNVVLMFLFHGKDTSFQAHWIETGLEKLDRKLRFLKFFICRFGNITAFHIKKHNDFSTLTALKVKAVYLPPYVMFPTNLNKTFHDKPVEKNLLSGFEIELMNVISKCLRIKVEYYISMKDDWGDIFFNGSATNSMTDLMTGKVDIAIGSFTVITSRIILFKMSPFYAEYNKVICVSNESYVQIWSNFFNISSFKLFLSIFIVYVLVTTLLWKTAQYCKEEHARYRKPSTAYLYCLAVILGISVNILPATRRARVFFSFLILFELFNVAFFVSFLASLLSTQKKKQDINTLNDVFRRNMGIYSTQDLAKYLNRIGQEKVEREISKYLMNCDNTKQCLQDVHVNHEKAICIDEYNKYYILQNYIRANTPSIYCLKDKLTTNTIGMIMRRSLSIQEQIGDIIGRSVASGLIHKWLSFSVNGGTEGTPLEPEKPVEVLKFTNLRDIFVLTAISFSFYSFIFIGELAYHYVFSS